MRTIIPNLNYLHVLVVAVAGFMLGWLWYSLLFGKVWMTEMKITPEKMQESQKKGMASYFIQGFVFTLLGTFGLAALCAAHGVPNWKHGAAYGAFVGVFIAMARMLNATVWEDCMFPRSMKLKAINLGHEFVLFALQGAILGAWH